MLARIRASPQLLLLINNAVDYLERLPGKWVAMDCL